MRKFKTVNELVNTLKPDHPVYCMRPEEIKKSVTFFKKNFPGKILYAVKTNPHEKIIKQVLSNGIKDFDVASLNEIKLIKTRDEIKNVQRKIKKYFVVRNLPNTYFQCKKSHEFGRIW